MNEILDLQAEFILIMPILLDNFLRFFIELFSLSIQIATAQVSLFAQPSNFAHMCFLSDVMNVLCVPDSKKQKKLFFAVLPSPKKNKKLFFLLFSHLKKNKKVCFLG